MKKLSSRLVKRKRIVIVLPAYYAAKTLEKTLSEIPKNFADEIILVDDGSKDGTADLAEKLGLTVFRHYHNVGYGGNQKTCYWEALKRAPDIIIMLHPDYQYDGSLAPNLIEPIIDGRFDIMIGNRVQTRDQVLKGGMPLYKYFGNRFLTACENIVLGQNLPEWHSGFRAFRREVLEKIPFQSFSNNFIFDQQILMSAVAINFKIGSIHVPCRYFPDASSINLRRSVIYGLSILYFLLLYQSRKIGFTASIFKTNL